MENEEQDPFAEFGGKAIKADTDPFAEFGGKTLKKKASSVASPISTTSSKSTYNLNEPFGASIVKQKEEPQEKKLPVVNTDDPKLTEGLKKAVSIYESINGKQPLLPASQDAIREMSPEEVATQKFRETPIGKTLTGLQYIGSKATKGAVNVVKGANGLLMDFASTQPSLMAPATVYNNKSDGLYDKVDKFTDLGLDPNQKHSMEDSHIMSNLGGAIEFGVPAYLGGELKAPQALVFGLQGLGSAKDETRKLREAGTPLDPTVEKAYEYGSAAIQAALFGELGSSIFGKMPLGLRKDVVSALSADLVKQGVEKNLTGAEFNNLLKQGVSSLKDKSAQALYKMAETGTHATKTLLTLNTANFALKKGVDELNSKPVFKQTAEDFVEGTKNALISGGIFGAVGGLGAMSKLSKYSSYKNEVVETLMKDPSTENLMKVKNQIAEHGANEGWSEQEVNDTNAQVDKIGEITSKLKATEEAVGKAIPKNKLVDAVDLVNGRTELQEQLKAVQEGKKLVDESVKSEPNKNEQYLVDKIDQANDVLSDLITGKKTKYEHDAELDKYYKVRGEEKTAIDKSRYELEQKEAPYRDEKAYSIDDTEIKPVETPKAKEQVVEPTEEVKPLDKEVKPVEVDVQEAQRDTDKVISKAEDDLKALKQVENKTAKYDGAMKRLKEAKDAKIISTKEFDEYKSRFDDVIADSKPKTDAKVPDAKLEPLADKEPTAKKYEKDKEVEFTPKNGEKIKFKLSDVNVQDRPSDTKENSRGEIESRMDVMANGVKIGDAEITDLGNDIRADYLELDRGNKGKGIGTVAYLSMAEHAKSLGKRLVSATANNRNEDSNAMLKRLEEQGIAKREGSRKGMYYVIDRNPIDTSKDFALKEIKKGAINWDGDMFTPRPELGMEWKDIRKGKQDLLDGKDTPASKRLVDAINKAKDDGGYNFVQGAGKANVKLFVPIDGKIPTNELSKEELNDITSKEAELASEYDRYFDSLTPEEKTEELNSIENGKETKTNTERESKTDVSDKETPKAGDQIRKFADKLRQGKVNKLGGFKTSTGFDGAWDLGLEAVATALDAGAKIVDAIEIGLKSIKNTEWYKNLENKTEFDTAFKEHMEKEYSDDILNEQTIEGAINETIGVSKSETAKQRRDRGLEDIQVQETATLKQMFEMGKDAVDTKEIDPRSLAIEVSGKPRNISKTEVNALLYDRKVLQVERTELFTLLNDAVEKGDLLTQDALRKRLDFTEQALTNNEKAVKSGARENALALSTMQNMINEDYSFDTQRARMESKAGGKLTEAQESELQKYINELEEAKKTIAEFENARKKEIAKKEILKAKTEARITNKVQSKEVLAKERETIFDDFLKELKDIRSSSNATVPYVRELVASVPFVSRLVTNLAKEGIVEFNDVVERIHEEFSKHIDGLKKEDIIDVLAGTYNTKKQTRDELVAQRYAMTRIAQLIKKVEDLQNGINGEKNEKRIANKRQEIVDLEKQVKELERENGLSLEDRTKESLKKRIEKIDEKIKNGDFEKSVREKLKELDPETITLKAKVRKAQNNFDAMAERLEGNKDSKINKVLDGVSAVKRLFILSGVKTLAKLYSFAAERAVSTPIEELFNTMNSKIPMIRKIAKISPRFAGGINVKAEARAIRAKWEKATWKDTWDVLKTGVSELDRLYGKNGVDKDFDLNPSALEFFGRLHGAFKNSTKRAEFFRSYEKRLQFEANRGKDINDPNVQFSTALESYADAKRAILMHDNMMTNGYKSFLRTIEGNDGKWEGKSVATFFRTLLPIIKIPTNYALEALDYSTFGVRALPYVIKAAIKGSESLTPSQANTVMRAMSKGNFGLAMMTIAYFNPQMFGGYYSGKRDEKDLKAGDVVIAGMHLPHFMTHHPVLEAMQIAATFRRAIDSANGNGADQGILQSFTTKNKNAISDLAVKKIDNRIKEPQSVEVNYNGTNYDVYVKNGEVRKIVKSTGFREGLKASVSGLSQQVPFFDTPGQISEGMKSDNKLNKFEGDFVRNNIEPRLLQEIAGWFDMRDGEVVKRDPKTMGEHLKVGIPVLRNTVPEKTTGNVRLQEIKVGSDTYVLNAEQVKERQKFAEEYIKEYSKDIYEGMREVGKTDKDIQNKLLEGSLDHSMDMMKEKYEDPNESGKYLFKLKNE